MRVSLCLLAVAYFIAGACAGKLPPFIKACSVSDPKLNQCIESAITVAGPKFAQGIPELGIKPLDPAELGRVVVNNPALKVILDDTVVTGLGGFRINSFKMNAEKGKSVLDFTANVTLKAHYDMDGKVLIVPIRGNGQAKIKITNLRIVIKYDFKTVDGHWTVTDHKDSYKMDRAQFKFTNLFNGNKELADTIDAVINEHWEPVIKDIAPTAFDTIINACVNEAKKLFASVPANHLLLP
ncbi:protein takeout-like isoform X2 [Vanessa cardui]|uniref:protein takeout-like isoform X2 n=1 Tax=Vanessa cardui TaxID=171605 RepID=UPI001F131050|nr:protein takeout-like isoform X2 [Vanessa cardui]